LQRDKRAIVSHHHEHFSRYVYGFYDVPAYASIIITKISIKGKGKDEEENIHKTQNVFQRTRKPAAASSIGCIFIVCCLMFVFMAARCSPFKSFLCSKTFLFQFPFRDRKIVIEFASGNRRGSEDTGTSRCNFISDHAELRAPRKSAINFPEKNELPKPMSRVRNGNDINMR
jgi:hypothetical protein